MRATLLTLAATAAVLAAALNFGVEPAAAQGTGARTLTIASGPSTQFLSGTTWGPAKVLTYGTEWPCVPGVWAPPISGSSWVDFASATGCGSNYGDKTGTFRNTFNLPVASNVSVTVRWLADNSATVSLNGTRFGANINDGRSYYFQAPSSASANGPFKLGTNVLRVDLTNWGAIYGYGLNPAGLDFVATVTYTPLTSTAQCMGGGWRAFHVFENQGDCISYVATKGKNLPDD